MGTVNPSQHRNTVAPRVEMTWQSVALAVIHGWSGADFASIVGGETVTIQVNGGVPTVITMLAGDNSLANVVARINATFPGLASSYHDGVRLADLNQVAVTAISQADFLLIGLPQINRDTAAPASNRWVVPLNANQETFADSIATTPIAIPDNVNRLGVYIYVGGNDANNDWGIQWGMLWSNGVEGATPFVDFGVFRDTLDDTNFPTTPDTGFAASDGYLDVVASIGALNGTGFLRYYEVEVPIGAIEARVFIWSAKSNGPNAYTASNPPPRRPPTFGAAVVGGAR